MRRKQGAIALFLVLVLGACSGSSSPTESSSTSSSSPSSGPGATTTVVPGGSNSIPEIPVTPLEWTDCGENLQCATLLAPLDYSRPQETAGGARISVVRHRALSSKKRIGSLVVNPGGPGFGGTYLARAARGIYGADILQAFDIVGFDPRGTGDTVPAIDCISDYDPYFAPDSAVDTPEGLQDAIGLAAAFKNECEERSGDILPFITTEDSARDIDLLRRALGEETISYLGFSYGSELGAAWATLFPDTVRAAVFDGAADPNASGMQSILDQAAGFERALNSFLDHCRSSCGFPAGADPGIRLDEILARIDANEYPTVTGRPRLSMSIAYSAVFQALYSTTLWPKLDSALIEADRGKGAIMLELYDDYYQRRPNGTYPNDLEAFIAITCTEDRGPYTLEEVQRFDDEVRAAAPRLHPAFLGNVGCIPWAGRAQEPVSVTGTDAVPILVIGTTNDPATPLASTKRMAEAMKRSVLLTVEGDGHTAYVRNKCTRKVVGDYLVGLKTPKPGTVCD